MMRLISIVICLFVCFKAIGSDSTLNKKLKEIEILINNKSDYVNAEKELDIFFTLLNKMESSFDYRRLKIEANLLKIENLMLQDKFYEALRITFESINESEKTNNFDLSTKAYLYAALANEIIGDQKAEWRYLQEAKKLIQTNHLDSIFSTYLVRTSSYYRQNGKIDSAIYFAYKGLNFSKKYNNGRDIRDCYLLLGATLPKSRYKESVEYYKLAIIEFEKINDLSTVATMQNNISNLFYKNDEIDSAAYYNNLAFHNDYKHNKAYDNTGILMIRSFIFEKLSKLDSALFYYKMYHEQNFKDFENYRNTEINKITSQFENVKKENLIRTQHSLLIFVLSLTGVIVFGSFMLWRKNQQIKNKNKVISAQLDAQRKLLSQKETLLSELQHRVKNNLQHVSSILELQKESKDFTSVEELIRENQNRIYSMSILHQKLSTSDNINEVNLGEYLFNLSKLVNESYASLNRDTQIDLNCTIDAINIEHALPLGMILVELISNSIKHAFGHSKYGIIKIKIYQDEYGQTYFIYEDNGKGFDFNKTSAEGLGLELIKGFIDQIDGKYTTKNNKHFKIEIIF